MFGRWNYRSLLGNWIIQKADIESSGFYWPKYDNDDDNAYDPDRLNMVIPIKNTF